MQDFTVSIVKQNIIPMNTKSINRICHDPKLLIRGLDPCRLVNLERIYMVSRPELPHTKLRIRPGHKLTSLEVS